MKKYLIISAVLLVSLVSSCIDGISTNEEILSQEDKYCDDFLDGNIKLKIDGKDWSANCVTSTQINFDLNDNYSRMLIVFGINYDNTFLEGRDVEIFYFTINEQNQDGELTRTVSAIFVDDWIDINSTGSQIDITEGLVYSSTTIDSNNTTETNNIEFDEYTDSFVSGALDFTLIEHESGEQISVTGDFNVTLEE